MIFGKMVHLICLKGINWMWLELSAIFYVSFVSGTFSDNTIMIDT
jgi:hypothetical protein